MPTTQEIISPCCLNYQSSVKDSRKFDGYIYRRRFCSGCSNFFTTIEVVIPEKNTNQLKQLALVQKRLLALPKAKRAAVLSLLDITEEFTS